MQYLPVLQEDGRPGAPGHLPPPLHPLHGLRGRQVLECRGYTGGGHDHDKLYTCTGKHGEGGMSREWRDRVLQLENGGGKGGQLLGREVRG